VIPLEILLAARKAELLPAVKFQPGLANARLSAQAEWKAADGAFTAEIRSDLDFRRLNRGEDFKAAKQIFDRWLNKTFESLSPRKAVAELDFLSAVLLWWLKPPVIFRDMRVDAVHKAVALYKLVIHGNGLPNRSENETLIGLWSKPGDDLKKAETKDVVSMQEDTRQPRAVEGPQPQRRSKVDQYRRQKRARNRDRDKDRER